MHVYNPHRHHRIVPILGLALSIPLSLVMVFLLVVNALYHDEPASNDSALLLSTVTMVDAENAYTDLQNASDAVLATDPAATQPRRDTKVEEMLNGGDWDAAYAGSVITTYRTAIDAVRAASTKQSYQDPATANPDTISFDRALTDLGEVRFAITLTALEALQKAKANDVDSGLAEAVAVVRVGHWLQSGQNSLITYLVGSITKQIGLSALRQVAAQVNLTADQALRVSTELDQYRDSTPGLVTSLRVEYAAYRDYQPHLRTLAGLYNAYNLVSDSNDNTLPEAPGTWLIHWLDGIGAMKFYYMPNQTWRWKIEETQQHIALASSACDTYTETETRRIFLNGFTANYFWTPNVIGKVAHDIGQISFGGLTIKRCNESVAISATQALLAINAYRTETKGWPTTLDSLVPKYLEHAPDDPYSGQAFKYNNATGTVYSVGSNHVDLGGSPIVTDWQTQDNPSFSIRPPTL